MMKKSLSIMLATAILSQFTVAAKAFDASITDIYADIYGITVEFDSPVKSSAIEGYTLTEDEKSIETSAEINGNFVTIVPNEQLKRDKKYVLMMADSTKEFIIKTLYYEDFSGKSGEVDQKTYEKNEYGEYLVLPDSGEIFYQNEELALANAMFSISDIYEGVNRKNVTYSLDVKGYGKKFNATAKPNAGLVEVMMGIRAQYPDASNEEYALRMTNARGYLGKKNENAEFISAANESYGENNEKFGFSTVSNPEIALGGIYSFETESEKRNVALRAYDDEITALIDGKALTSISDKTYTSGFFNISANLRTLLVIDNVLVTACMEELTAEKSTCDSEGIKVFFNKSLDGVTDFSKIRVYENDTLIEADISVDKTSNSALNIIPKDYRAGVTYKTVIENGYSVYNASTCKEYSFENSVDMKTVSVEKTEADLIDGITVYFDTELGNIADTTKVKAFENGIEVAADKQIINNMLKIKPDNYALGNTYKIEIEEDFLNKNFYLFNAYSYEKTLEKRNLSIEKLECLSTGFLVHFSENIPETITAKVTVETDDTPVPLKEVSVDGKKLTVKLDGNLSSENVYELHIEKGAETQTAIMKDSYLRRIKNGAVIACDDIELSNIKFDINSEQQTVNGSFKMKNFSDSDKKVSIAAVAYGEDNIMQAAMVFDLSEIDIAEIKNVEFTLNKVSDAKQIRVFVWDTLNNLNLCQYKCIDLIDGLNTNL